MKIEGVNDDFEPGCQCHIIIISPSIYMRTRCGQLFVKKFFCVINDPSTMNVRIILTTRLIESSAWGRVEVFGRDIAYDTSKGSLDTRILAFPCGKESIAYKFHRLSHC
jgi:hypothetical protein